MLTFNEYQKPILDAFHLQEYIRDQYAILDWSLYDRCITPAGAMTPEVYHFYSIPANQTHCQVCNIVVSDQYCSRCGRQRRERKSYADTNMTMANKLPARQAFSLNKSLFFLLSKSMSDYDQTRLLEQYHWELRLGMKSYCMGPLARFPNVCPFDTLKPQPFTAPVDDPALLERNRNWLETQKPERRTAPHFREAADHVLDLLIPVVIEYEWTFRMDVVGKPFQTESGVTFMSVMEGLAAMGVQ